MMRVLPLIVSLLFIGVALAIPTERARERWGHRDLADSPVTGADSDTAELESAMSVASRMEENLTPEQKAHAKKQWGHFKTWVKGFYTKWVKPRLLYVQAHKSAKFGSVFKNPKPIPMDGWEFKIPDEFSSLSYNDARNSLFGLNTAKGGARRPGTSFLQLKARESGIWNSDNHLRKPMVDDQPYILDKKRYKNYQVWLKANHFGRIPAPPNLDKLMEKMYEGLPKEYNFFKKYPGCLREPLNQGKCGGCWAFATTGMLTHRVCKQVFDAKLTPPPKDWRLSPQSLISCCGRDCCGHLGNCCQGGTFTSAVLWLKHTKLISRKKWEIVSEYGSWGGLGHQHGGRNLEPLTCSAYESADGDQAADECKADNVECGLYRKGQPAEGNAFKRNPIDGVKVATDTDLPYNFNSYPEFPPMYWRGGQLSYWPDKLAKEYRSTLIMRELLTKGPLGVGFHVPTSFLGFTGKGVYRKEGPYIKQRVNRFRNGLVGAGHGVVLVGWGEEKDGTKYWLLENSWGKVYKDMPKGFQGMFKIRRGVDECNMESIHQSTIGVNPVLDINGKMFSVAEGWKLAHAKH